MKTMKTSEQVYQYYGKSELEAAKALDENMRIRNDKSYEVGMCGSCRLVHSGSCAIPDAPIYVCSNDTFMSGWGNAKNQINVCVVPCASWDEAKKVRDYIDSRSDQKYTRIVGNKPKARGRLLSLLSAWRYNALGMKEPRTLHNAI